MTVNVAVLVADPSLAVTVAALEAVTVSVEIVKFADVAPAGIVTDVGGLTQVPLDVSVTVVSPEFAALMETVPVADAPPATEVGEIVKEDNVGTATVISCVNDTPA